MCRNYLFFKQDAPVSGFASIFSFFTAGSDPGAQCFSSFECLEGFQAICILSHPLLGSGF